ncbi:transcription factor TFIIIB component B'' homolog [Dendroctonus ponderosae]|nr:transcription factor TFIIIB component B'' homolog [Dendroctonus ponderosae]KAH1006331.1 hypothetical protein HUJ05_007078 [Dendroctonus ponderosae]
MASRRTRVKAVANFTHRKKPPLSSAVNSTEAFSADDLELPTSSSSTIIEKTSIIPQEECCDLKAKIAPASNKIVILDDLKVRPAPQPNGEAPKVPLKSPISEKCASSVETQPADYPLPASPVKKMILDSSDSEYPAPYSPSKINRSRIRPIPRLDTRKPSASESEDESRRYGRKRHNSVCSVASTVCLEPQTPTTPHLEQKDTAHATPKKIFRNEQTRRLAEARRDFHKRFGSAAPDKQQLRMIDLIFYNPNSNPMSQKTERDRTQSETTVKQVKSEAVDDPAAPEAEENEPESSLPVPQIKIGPSGEIILDEQSVVMENTQVAKQKEQIQKSKIVDGDSTATYGIYKKVARSLPWSQKETVRFYKALNLIGTDFTLMATLFPTRSRRELKIKFKKEEKNNIQLVERAIKDPCSYNFADLKREVEVEREEEAILQKIKDDELRSKTEPTEKQTRKRKRKEPNRSAPTAQKLPTHAQKSVHSDDEATELSNGKTPAGIESAGGRDGDADISDFTQSDTDEEEFIPFLKPTRFGRMPKSTLKFNEPLDLPGKCTVPKKRPYKKAANIDKTPSRSCSPSRLPVGLLRDRRLSSASSVDSNAENLVPGAVIITAEEDAKGQQQYKVFMVTPEKKLAPVEMDSQAIATLVAEKSVAELPLTPSLPERNVTIPASSVDSQLEPLTEAGNVAKSGQGNEVSVEHNNVAINCTENGSLSQPNDKLIPEEPPGNNQS